MAFCVMANRLPSLVVRPQLWTHPILNQERFYAH